MNDALGTTQALSRPPIEGKARGGVGQPIPHESAHLHVTGEATYTDDILELRGTLHAAFALSASAHARIASIALDEIRAASDVVAVLTAADIPGENNYGSVVKDDPILAEGEVQYVGQPVVLVVARSVDAARKAAKCARLEYEELPPMLAVDEALAARSLLLPSVTLERGNVVTALTDAAHRRIAYAAALPSVRRSTSTLKVRSRTQCRRRTVRCTSTARRNTGGGAVQGRRGARPCRQGCDGRVPPHGGRFRRQGITGCAPRVRRGCGCRATWISREAPL